MNYLTLKEIAKIPKFIKVFGDTDGCVATLRKMAMNKRFEAAMYHEPNVASGVGYILKIDIEHPDFESWWVDYLKLPTTKGKIKRLEGNQEKKAS